MTYVPSRSAVKGLSRVVPALTVSSHNENLVARLITASVTVKMLDILLEALPLGLVALSGVLGVCGIGAIQETEVPLSLSLLVMIAHERSEVHT